MGGGGTTSTTQSTQSNNPQLTSTLNKLLGSGNGVSGLFDKGPQVFDQSLYGGVGDTTKNAWESSLGSANNSDYMSGIQGALADQGAKASGQNLGLNDPTFQAMRDKLSSDVMGNVGSSFTNSGRFGGGSYVDQATNSLVGALAPLDYQQVLNGQQQQQQAIANMPGLFAALQAPSSTVGAVGAAQDADAQGQLSGNADLFNRQNNGPLTLLQQLSGVLNGSSGSAGTTTTQTQPQTPWWSSALGLGMALL